MNDQNIKDAVVKFLLKEKILLEGNTEWLLKRQDGTELVFNDLFFTFIKEYNLENSNKLGRAIDRVENMQCALNIPLPLSMHVQQFKSLLPEIVTELIQGFLELTSENPWAEFD